MKRFTKAQLIHDLRCRAERLQQEHKFDPGNGYAQVTNKGEAINRYYGEWKTLLDLAKWIEGGYIGVIEN